MTIMRIQFAGQIKKVEHKEVGGKPLAEVSICRKHKGRNGAEDSFTWLRISLWEPADFQLPGLVKGGFIAGGGDVQLRSYIAKDNSKGSSLECRCSSFDVEVSGSIRMDAETAATSATAKRAPMRSPTALEDDDQPPF